jgi:hypothetical protein
MVEARTGVDGGAPPAMVEIEYDCAKARLAASHNRPTTHSFPASFNMHTSNRAG